ncbi:MAG: M48 family metalloprotease [Deltaproteobacteria bacterium]
MNSSLSLPKAWIENDKNIKPYLWSHRVLSIGKGCLTLGLLIWFVVSLRSFVLEIYLEKTLSREFFVWLAYFGIIGAILEVCTFPFSLGHQWVEKTHQLSKQTYLSWFWDKVKGWILGGVLGTLFLGILNACVVYTGDHWWWVTAILFVGVSIILAQLAPVVLIPIFFKLEPMEMSPLKERLLKMCESFGVEVKEVYHLGMGEKTEKGNAAFVGLGKTKRIMIGDTLYKKFPAEEVEAVFAHELGHQVHNDLWKGIILSSSFLFLVFYLTKFLLDSFVHPYFQSDMTHPFGALSFFVVFSLVQMPVGFVQTLFSRWRERMADQFAFERIGSGEKLASALEQLTYQNRGLFKPNKFIEFFTYSHPAPWRRILKLRGVKAS